MPFLFRVEREARKAEMEIAKVIYFLSSVLPKLIFFPVNFNYLNRALLQNSEYICTFAITYLNIQGRKYDSS